MTPCCMEPFIVDYHSFKHYRAPNKKNQELLTLSFFLLFHCLSQLIFQGTTCFSRDEALEICFLCNRKLIRNMISTVDISFDNLWKLHLYAYVVLILTKSQTSFQKIKEKWVFNQISNAYLSYWYSCFSRSLTVTYNNGFYYYWAYLPFSFSSSWLKLHPWQ